MPPKLKVDPGLEKNLISIKSQIAERSKDPDYKSSLDKRTKALKNGSQYVTTMRKTLLTGAAMAVYALNKPQIDNAINRYAHMSYEAIAQAVKNSKRRR